MFIVSTLFMYFPELIFGYVYAANSMNPMIFIVSDPQKLHVWPIRPKTKTKKQTPLYFVPITCISLDMFYVSQFAFLASPPFLSLRMLDPPVPA